MLNPRPRRTVTGLATLGGLVLIAASATPSLGVARPGAATDDVAMVGVSAEAERFWSRWRGPSGQGHVEGTGYADRWSSTENVRWRVPVPGAGNSSPIVWGDRIFLTAAFDGGRQVAMLAFRRSDGELLWQTDMPRPPVPESPHGKNGHASSTPSTDGERVYAYLGNHGLVAVNFDGTIAWHRDFGQILASHGTAGSPLLHDGKVIVYQDMRGGTDVSSFVAAFDAGTGETVWWTDREQNTGWGTPIAVRVGDAEEIVVSSQRRVYAYDPESGDELWQVDGNLFEVIPTPVVGHGMVFTSSGRAGPTLAIRPGGRGNVTDSHLVWSSPKGSPFIPSTLIHGDYLYMINDMSSILTAYVAATGTVAYQGRLGNGGRESFSASPVVVDDKIFVTNDAGETFVIAAGGEFELLHINRIGEPTLASPALVDGVWYIRTAEHLFAIAD
jgi:outer membrane protein assembly factor BamB